MLFYLIPNTSSIQLNINIEAITEDQERTGQNRAQQHCLVNQLTRRS